MKREKKKKKKIIYKFIKTLTIKLDKTMLKTCKNL